MRFERSILFMQQCLKIKTIVLFKQHKFCYEASSVFSKQQMGNLLCQKGLKIMYILSNSCRNLESGFSSECHLGKTSCKEAGSDIYQQTLMKTPGGWPEVPKKSINCNNTLPPIFCYLSFCSITGTCPTIISQSALSRVSTITVYHHRII